MQSSRMRIYKQLLFAMTTAIAVSCTDPAIVNDASTGLGFDASLPDRFLVDQGLVDSGPIDRAHGEQNFLDDRALQDTGSIGGETDGATGQDHIVGVADPNGPDNQTTDSDCDGLSDEEEYGTVFPSGDRTDPNNPDSDGDGLLDGLELGRSESCDPRCDFFTGDADPNSQTNPTMADSDADGLLDGEEDQNHNGRYEAGAELDPRDPDSDDDGLCDGPGNVPPICSGQDPDPFSRVQDSDSDGVPDSVDANPHNPDADGDGLCDGPRSVSGICDGGEDLNADGVVGANESDPQRADTDCDGLDDGDEQALGTNPRKSDSDGDLINDGVEAGATPAADSHCPARPSDADPGSQTDPLDVDSDGDGIHDGVEDCNQNGQVDPGETDPNNPDSDGDGLCDGPPRAMGSCSGGEDLNANGQLDPGESDPLVAGSSVVDSDSDGLSDSIENASSCLDAHNPDSDGDGLNDGSEDIDMNGRVDLGETDPCLSDSDCDGLVDGLSYGAFTGEQTMGTNPIVADTDGDGLIDGLEVGIMGGAIPAGTQPGCGFTADADPSHASDPNNPDSDGDGIPDGAEDSNQNGRLDDGELDPETADATAAVSAACGQDSLVPVLQDRDWQPDIQIVSALRNNDQFSQRSQIVDMSGGGQGEQVGLMAFNPDRSVVYLAISKQPAGQDSAAEEQSARQTMQTTGALSLAITSQFQTWDGYSAVRASFHQNSALGLKAQANALVQSFVPNSASLLSLANDVSTSAGFELRAEFVYRSANTAIVLIAISPSDQINDASLNTLNDSAGGSALGQYADGLGTQCDRFRSQGYTAVDFLWAVDNSGSMSDDQAAVAATSTEMASILNGSTMDWRMAMVSSDYDQNLSATCSNLTGSPCRLFSSDMNVVEGWFDPNSNSWISDAGSGTERTMYGAQLIIRDRFLPSSLANPAPNNKIRRAAYLVTIFLTDAEDQRSGYSTAAGRQSNIGDYSAFFQDWDPDLPHQQAILGGILCAPGQTSGCDPRPPYSDHPVIHDVINNLGGVIGDLKDTATIRPTILQILANVAGATSPYILRKPAISSTIKVAMAQNSTVGPCNWNDLPRNQHDGFDYDPIGRSIVFYGNCRPDPNQSGSEVVVSYRFWNDRSPDPDGPESGCNCAPPLLCDPLTLDCYCPPDCGEDNVPAERVCDTNSCTLTCRPDCGASCSGQSTCNPAPDVCACECPADCGGPAPADNYSCNRDPLSPGFCQWECDSCPGTPSSDLMQCDPLACAWVCPDCDDCPGLATCGAQSCRCECNQSLSCGEGYRWDDQACNCVCDAALLACDNNHLANEALCACICAEDCGGQCDGGTYCNQSLCLCMPSGA